MTMHTNGMHFCDMENGHSNITNLEWRFFFFVLEVFFVFFGMGKKCFHYLRGKKEEEKNSPPMHPTLMKSQAWLVP